MKPPFDTVKACFYLVAVVIAVHLVIVVIGAFACIWDLDKWLTAGKECPAGGRLSEVLGAALAAALAFAGGKSRGD